MAFHVFVKQYGQDPVCINPGYGTTARQAIRLLGSHIRGKRRSPTTEEAYAVGRYGWRYSQADLVKLIGG